MRVQREQQTITLGFSFVESQILLGVLRALIKTYQIQPGELDSKVASVWYSIRGCHSAKMSPEETAEWLNTLHELKNGTLPLLEQWVRQLARKSEPGYRLGIECDHASAFLAAINDYRLMAAAAHDIGQAEMDLDFPEAITSLTPQQQKTLVEIDLLAWIIEAILRCLAESPRSESASPSAD